MDANSKQPQSLPSCQDLLAPGGVIARLLPGYEARPQQLEMAERVATALNNSGLLTVEAATGTGMSLAYLAPLALHALKTDREPSENGSASVRVVGARCLQRLRRPLAAAVALALPATHLATPAIRPPAAAARERRP